MKTLSPLVFFLLLGQALPLQCQEKPAASPPVKIIQQVPAAESNSYEIFRSTVYRSYTAKIHPDASVQEKNASAAGSKTESKDLKCDVLVPAGKGPFPAVLMLHGGGWRSGTKLQIRGHAISVVQADFVVVAINYRHAPEFKWPAQLQDCHHALQWMTDNAEKYKIDPEQLAAWGYSAGGHLASFLATTSNSDVGKKFPIRAAVCGGGPVDLTQLPEDFPFLGYFLGGSRRQFPKRYAMASPITHLTKNDPPLFLFHGRQDYLVPIQGVEDMKKKADDLGVRCELAMVESKGHILTFFDQHSIDLGVRFLKSIFSPSDLP